MAVQAQYPSNVFLSDFCNRNLPLPPANSTPMLLHESDQLPPIAANWLWIYNSVAGMNAAPQPVLNTGTINDTQNDFARNFPSSRKRVREDEEIFGRQLASFMPPSDFQQNNSKGSFAISQSAAPISTGLCLTFNDARLAPTTASTSGKDTSGSPHTSILNEKFQSQFLKQSEEIDQLIKLQGERMKQALEEKRHTHTRALLALLEESVLRRVTEKEVELERISRRNLELEERVKQLSLESQLWQNMARNSEAIVLSLRSNLEKAVAQSREQSKEGCGESDADDAESCNFEEALDDAHARTIQENKDLKEQRSCRVCKANSICILLLPCRHLCLCKECDTFRADCPLCGAAKNASVQVYMD